MLILSRKPKEAFIINGNIKITFLGLNSHGQCKFGIDAPREISIHREEIQERINQGLEQEHKPRNRYCYE
jgi:carbon storage regulator